MPNPILKFMSNGNALTSNHTHHTGYPKNGSGVIQMTGRHAPPDLANCAGGVVGQIGASFPSVRALGGVIVAAQPPMLKSTHDPVAQPLLATSDPTLLDQLTLVGTGAQQQVILQGLQRTPRGELPAPIIHFRFTPGSQSFRGGTAEIALSRATQAPDMFAWGAGLGVSPFIFFDPVSGLDFPIPIMPDWYGGDQSTVGRIDIGYDCSTDVVIVPAYDGVSCLEGRPFGLSASGRFNIAMLLSLVAAPPGSLLVRPRSSTVPPGPANPLAPVFNEIDIPGPGASQVNALSSWVAAALRCTFPAGCNVTVSFLSRNGIETGQQSFIGGA
jgi:hypothetical protein